MDYSARGLADVRVNPGLRDYFASANIHMTRLEATGVLQARVAQFPQLTFAHAILPPSTLEWPRDALSLDRGVMIVCRTGDVTVTTDAPFVARAPGLVLVPPGDSPVRFDTHAPTNEVVYISTNAEVMREFDLTEPIRDAAAIPAGAVAPFYSFATSLCSISLPGAAGLEPLQTAAKEIARGLAATIVGDAVAPASLFARGMHTIVRDYAQSRLTVGTLASTMGVAERTLHAAFAAEGTTVMRELRAVRSAAATRMRSLNPGLATRDVAVATGFGSVSSMLRAAREFDSPYEGRIK